MPANHEAITASRTKAHRRAVEDSFPDIIGFLVDHLGKVLTSEIAGASPQTIERWRSASQAPTLHVERRMREAYAIFIKLSGKDASATIRAWFMGMNPQLDDVSPVEALRGDNYRDVAAAADAFLIGG
ncbi:hypothetical protein [Arthrobacter sp. H14]|uniref:hypothetical protein n=1 Tax=Arthrobacter sp. H14 TaxID=1312959 RepID=UPI00055AC98D|nr:hypothetical protein [Arthrobacter sp. H14]